MHSPMASQQLYRSSHFIGWFLGTDMAWRPLVQAECEDVCWHRLRHAVLRASGYAVLPSGQRPDGRFEAATVESRKQDNLHGGDTCPVTPKYYEPS